MSLLTSFNVGVQGLHSAQAGLNTTSHNLANTKTPGYTRQQNINTDTYYHTYRETSKATLQIGLGTTVATVRQIRDMFLDKEYRYEFSRQTFYEQQLETEMEIEDVLGEMEGVEFRNALADMWSQIQTLSTNPESVVNRELFISEAEAFIEKAGDVYTALTNYQTGLNKEISKQVDRINEISDKVAQYNTLIAYAEASGLENANDYRDTRNLLLDELAGYTYFTYEEDRDGKIQVYVSGAPLVIEGISYHMHCERIAEDSSMYKVVWSDNGYGDVYDLDEAYSTPKKTDTGSLLGILTARGSKFAKYTDMPIAPEEPKEEDYRDAAGVLDKDAYDAAYHDYEVAYKGYEEEVKKFNNTTGNSVITKIETQFDQLIHDVVTMINDTFCPNMDYKVAADITKTDAGNTVTLLKAGNYKILDVVNCPVGTDDEGTIGEELFKRTGSDRYQVITLNSAMYLKDENGADVLDADGNKIPVTKDNGDGTYSLYVYNEEAEDDFASLYTINNLEVNDKILANYSILPVKANPSAGNTGAYAQDLYPAMLSKWQEKGAVLDPNTLTEYAYDEYYNEMVGALGTQGMVWSSIVDNQTALTDGVEDKRQQMSGVSTDEELVSLITYQHAYNAAARYINTIDQMLQHLIERLF